MRHVIFSLLLLGGCSGTSGSVLATDGGAMPDLVPSHDLYGLGPHATILHPADGEVRTAGTDIPFVGHAADPTDGTLTGSAIVWRSSLAGQIGTGEMFNAQLAAGMHVITMTATDSVAMSDSMSITLNVN